MPRALIREIDERIDCMGDEVVPLDEAAVEAAVRSLVEDAGVTAIAIAFLWSFKNPAHELRALEIVRRVAPDVYVSCSHQVAPRMGEYERTVATVINSYVAPASAAYFRRAADRLNEAGLRHPLLIMQISGGVLPADKAVEIPLTSLGSGPVGGLMGSLSLARQLGHKNIIATDMGGTSFEVGLIIDGEPLVGEEKIIDQYRYRLPQLETTSIACGGGSIARVDPHSRSIRVGPESAGADPGPVCYRRGGTEPTVTDADVVLGAAFGRRVPGRPHAPRPRGAPWRPSPAWGSRWAWARRDGRRHPAHQQRAGGGAHQAADGGAGLRPARFRGVRLRRGRPAARLRLRQGAGGQGRRHPAGQRGLHAFGLRLLHVQPRAQHREGAALLRPLPGGRAEQL